jgi:adenosine kinase
MNTPSDYAFPHAGPADFALIGPMGVADMRRLPGIFRDKGVPYIFDPGQQIPALSGNDLLDAITGSAILISNDYEMEMILQQTGKTRDEIAALTGALIVTLGENGSLTRQGAAEIRIGIAQSIRVADPTGCGDAYRAGLLKGLSAGLPLPDCARLGAVCASYCVEHAGPQDHVFTPADFADRCQAAFGMTPPACCPAASKQL